jgi:hypothetical protein
MPAPAPGPQHGYNFANAGQQPFAPLGYPAPSPSAAAPGNAPPLVGASGLPVTPSSAPFAPNPFTYAGGLWPGMSIAQDPVTGHTFWTYTPPVGPTDTPTRGAGREQHQFYHGAK